MRSADASLRLARGIPVLLGRRMRNALSRKGSGRTLTLTMAGLAAGALILMATPSPAALVVGPAMTDIAPAGGGPAQPYTPNLPAPSSTDLLQGLTPTSYFHPTVNLTEANFREESAG